MNDFIDVDFDPSKKARAERKAKVAKNEKQRLHNAARAMPSERDARRHDINTNKTLATTRVSTASMGRFDKKLEGEGKIKGVKRKVALTYSPLHLYSNVIFQQFEPTEAPIENEKWTSLALISRLDSDAKK